jgi:hypothetical protein
MTASPRPHSARHTDPLITPPSPSLQAPLSTADCLTRSLSPYHKRLKAAHVNAQSLRAHIDEVREIFHPTLFDLIGVSESWLKPSIHSNEVFLPGYVLQRNDRIGRQGGGVAVYIREDLKFKILSSSPAEYLGGPEFLLIEISLSGADALLLGVCYRPPRSGHLLGFENALLNELVRYSHVLIMGDFNTDLLPTTQNYEYRQLTTMFDSCNLTVLPLEPTHHTADSDTFLDLLVVSNRHDIIHHGQLPVPAISKHDLIYCVYSIKLPKPSTH